MKKKASSSTSSTSSSMVGSALLFDAHSLRCALPEVAKIQERVGSEGTCLKVYYNFDVVGHKSRKRGEYFSIDFVRYVGCTVHTIEASTFTVFRKRIKKYYEKLRQV